MNVPSSKLTGRENLVLVAGCLLVVTLTAVSVHAQEPGQNVFLHKCAVCHAKDGSGNTAKGKKLKVKDVHENTQKDSEEKMIEIVQKGKGEDMDGYQKELSKDDIQAVVKYYRSLAK